jgi:polar amino acid transport system permease protein
MGYQFNWGAVFNLDEWLNAILITCAYAFGTIAAGFVIGVVVGVALISKRLLIRLPARLYVQFFRCTPLLVQIVWFYYALPILSGWTISAWIAAGLGLSLYMGAFSAEIFRGGIMSIERGQWDAARALGLSHMRPMRFVILPQAARRMLRPFANQCVLQLKNTSLLYVVAVPDLMYTSYEISSRTYRPLETYTLVALFYFLLLSPMTMLVGKLEGTSPST